MKDLLVGDIDAIERDLNKLGTPPDNCFRRMIAEIRRRRRTERLRKTRARNRPDDRCP